jgi:hypothetical protein
MSIAPAKKSVALWGKRNEMTMNDFTKIMRDGFGLHLPDVFPDDIKIEDVEILYSPNGGEIGEFKLEQGFALAGKAQLMNAATAQIDYFANWDDGFYLDYKIDADFRTAVMNEVEKTPLPSPVIEKVLSTFQLRKVHTHLEAGMDLKMSGSTDVQFEVFGHTHSFKMQASLDPEAIIDGIIDKIKEQAKVVELANEVVKVAGAAANASINTAKAGYDKLGYYAKHATEWNKHKFHGSFGNPSCMDKCVPDRANKLSGPVYKSSNSAVTEFYHKVIPKLGLIKERDKREELIKSDWNRLVKSIDNNWEKIIHDDLYKGFDKDQSDVEKLGEEYRKLVRARKQDHVNVRKKMWHRLMTETDESNQKYNVYRIYSVASDELAWDIPGYHFNAHTKGGKLNIYKDDNGADRFIKVIDNPDGTVTFQPQHSDNVIDVTGGSSKTGVAMQLWHSNNTAAQKFKLHKVPGRIAKTFFIETKDGHYLTAGKPVTQEKPTKAENQMWYFEKAYTSQMAPPPNGKYRFRAMVGKNLYFDIPGSGKHAKGKGAKLQLWTMDHHPDRTIEIKQRKSGKLYTLQPQHSKYVFDVAGGSKNNGADILLWDYNKGTNQLFEFIYAGAPRVYNIRIAHSGKFMDASGGNASKNGTKVHQWKGHNGVNQKWKLEKVGPYWAKPPKHQAFFIRPAYSKKYWDLGGDGAETNQKGKRFKLWTLNNGGDRMYKFKPSGDNAWLNIEVQNGGRRVDVKGGKVRSNGAPLHLWDAHGGDAQKFAMKPTSRNTFILFSKGYKAVDVKGGDIYDNGSAIHLWSPHYGASQQFVLEYANGPKKGQLYNFEGF